MNDDVGLDRLVGRDGDHAVLQLVELLPAVEQRLEGRVAGALERAADAVGAADAGRADAEPLQLGGGDLVADVERLGDERRLLRAAAARRGRAGRRWQRGRWRLQRRRAAGSIFWPLSAASISAWRCSIRRARASVAAERLARSPCGRVTKLRGGVAGPGDERRAERRREPPERGGNAEAAKLRAVVDEEVAVAEQCRRRGQNLRHLIPAPQVRRAHAARCTDDPSQIRSSPAPRRITRIAHPRAGSSETACGWLTNSTCRFPLPGRVVRSAAVNRSNPARHASRIRANSSCCAAAASTEFAARIFRAALPRAAFALEPAAGHAVPTRRVLSARRVTLTEAAAAGAIVRRPNRDPTRAPVFLVRPLRQAARLDARQCSTRARSAARIAAAIGKAAPRRSDRAHARAAASCPPTTGSASSRRPTPARWRWRSGRCSARAR